MFFNPCCNLRSALFQISREKLEKSADDEVFLSGGEEKKIRLGDKMNVKLTEGILEQKGSNIFFPNVPDSEIIDDLIAVNASKVNLD